MTQSVTITTGARLHFGPLAVRAESGPDFGGLGLMVESPRCVVTVAWSDQDRIEAGDQSGRITDAIAAYRRSRPAPPFEIRLHESIPEHAGFGSGTQLALAIARGLAALTGEDETEPDKLARRIGRGKRSAIGIYGFAAGGLIVDAGHRDRAAIGDLAARLDVPAAWRFVLITPPRQGLSGQRELAAFERLPPMSPELTGRLCRLVLCDILPAVQVNGFSTFAAALADYGTQVGEYFGPVQGGVFSDPRMLELAHALRERCGVSSVQTSWGPSIAALCPDEATAADVAGAIAADGRWSDCSVISTAALNRGAIVQGAEISGRLASSAQGSRR